MDLKRKYFKKTLTGKLGRVVEKEDKIICYVRKSKCKKEKNRYTIHCYGVSGKNKELAEKYNLNKPICYVIENKQFTDGEVFIFGRYNNEVIIKDCDFKHNLYVLTNGKCILENTAIRTASSLILNAKEIVLKDMKLNYSLVWLKRILKFDIFADKRIDIINSDIGDESIDISLETDKDINIINSNIIGDEVLISANKIIADENSSIESKFLELEVEEYKTINIRTLEFVHKKMNLTREIRTVIANKQVKSSRNTTEKLLENLEMLKNECIASNQENSNKEQLEYKEKIKILKK